MAIYHLSAQVISRGYGHSAVHAAAYRARDDLTDERTGLRHDYSRKADELLFEGIYAPKDAPDWARARPQLWNHVEAFEKHRRAELAREYVIALPHELTLDQNRYAVQDWVRDNFTRKGLIADVTIHAPSEQGDERNMHAHIMVVMRKLDGSEFIRAKERYDTFSEKDAAKKAELESLRESWARTGNRHLERHGFEPTLDHRTLDAQGIEREPTLHMGKSATAIERDGNLSELGGVNREISAENERKVIDLAAERVMREARAAAMGQVEDIRPATASRDFSASQTAPEAAQTREAPAAASAPERENTRATEPEREPAPARDAPRVIYLGPPAAELMAERAADIVGGLADGAEKALGATLDYAADFIAPPPPPTKEQVEQMQKAAEERRQQEPAQREQAEQEARFREILEQIRRDDQRARYDRWTGRRLDGDHDHDRDEDYSRGRGRER
jgi:MobA/MobL family